MIVYLEGQLLKKETDRIHLLVRHVGYEILVPAFVMESLASCDAGDDLALYIYYHQTEHQPKPVLIGFNLEAEREFFQLFISVETIGPLKAVKALNLPVTEIARAIEAKEVNVLKRLSGIGERMANKIIATLHGRTSKFALIRKAGQESEAVCPEPDSNPDFAGRVVEVLVEQLGHRLTEARELVNAALQRKPGIENPEDLFDEVYRGQSADGNGEQ